MMGEAATVTQPTTPPSKKIGSSAMASAWSTSISSVMSFASRLRRAALSASRPTKLFFLQIHEPVHDRLERGVSSGIPIQP